MPNVAYLRIFRCVAYAQVPEVERKKLDNHNEKYIFIKYNEESKAYKLYNPLTKKLMVSKDVVFNEAQAWTGAMKRLSKSNSWWINLMSPIGDFTTSYTTISSACYTPSSKRLSIF